MKNLSTGFKYLFTIILLVSITISCSDNTNEIKKQKTTNYQEFFSKSKSANLNLFGTIDLSKSVRSDDNKRTISFSPESIKQQFHSTYESYGLGFDAEILKPINFNGSIGARTSTEITEEIKAIDSHFGDHFYELLTNINDALLTNVDYLDQFNVEAFVLEVEQNNQLSEDERVMLISYLSSLASTVTFMENGGIEQIEAQIKEAIIAENPNIAGRIQECNVNVRSVLIDGVYGLATGAVTGAIYGGTAGTFTVPILGTATGAVGGAVFGAAAGFFSGVIGGVVTQLASTCTRTSGYTEAACEQTIALFHAGLLNSYPNCGLNGVDFNVNSGPRKIGNFFSANLILLN